MEICNTLPTNSLEDILAITELVTYFVQKMSK